MRALLGFTLISTLAAAPPARDAALDLQQVIQSTLAKPAVEDLDVEVAASRLRLLEASNRRRIELTPQLGLLSLTNPALLAANLGAGLLMKSGGVSPLAIIDAKVDLLAAETASRRRRQQREAEVTRHFFDMGEQQRVTAQTCAAVREAEGRREDLGRQLSLARLTRADLLRHEMEIVNRKADCRQAQRQLQLAATRLSAWVDTPPEMLRVTDEPADALSLDYPLRPVDFLVTVAMTHRAEPARLSQEIDSLRKEVDGVRQPRGLQFGLRYSYLGQSGTGPGGGGYLLGGHILQPEISARIPIRDNGAFGAEKRLLHAKLARLEREVSDAEQEIRAAIAEVQIRFESARDELSVARSRLALAAENRKVVAARHRAGLEGPASLSAAEEGERRAGVELVRLEYAGKSNLAALLSICGLAGREGGKQDMLVARIPLAVQ